MFCFHCGKQIKDGSSFCPFCGQNLREETNTQAEPQIPTGTQATEQNHEWNNNAGQVAVKQAPPPAQESYGAYPYVQNPYPENPAPMAQPQVAIAAKTPSGGYHFKLGILYFFILLLLFVFLASASVRAVGSDKMVDTLTSEIDMTDITLIGVYQDGEETYPTVEEYILQKANSQSAMISMSSGSLDKKDVREIMEITDAQGFFDEAVEDLVNSYMTGDEPEGIEAEDIATAYLQNRSEIEEIYGSNIDSDEVISAIYKYTDEYNTMLEDQVGRHGSFSWTRTLVSVIASPVLFILTGIVLLLLMIYTIVFRYSQGRDGGSLTALGVLLTVVSGIYTIAFACIGFIVDAIGDKAGDDVYVDGFISDIIGIVQSQMIKTTAIYAAAGVVLIILGIIIKKFIYYKRTKTAAAV